MLRNNGMAGFANGRGLQTSKLKTRPKLKNSIFKPTPPQLHHEYYPPPPPVVPSGAPPGMTPSGGGGLNTSSDSGSSGSSGNNNTTKLTSHPHPAAEQQDQKRTVNFKLEIKQDPEVKHESISSGDMCKAPQKVPSISDLSETESSLDLPTHQVR